jgi:hypothetical protein
LLGYVLSLSFPRAKLLLPLALTLIIISLNIFFDFRGMAGLGFVCAFFIFRNSFEKAKVYKKIFYLSVFVVVGVAVVGAYIQSGEGNNRRDYSNITRSAMTLHAANDLLSPSVLGNGYDSFKGDFEYPAVGDSKLEANKDGTLTIHGYFWLFSYEAGKLSLVIFICFFILSGRIFYAYLRGQGAPPEEYLLLTVYALYCSFMHTFVGFDRWRLAFAIAAVVFYQGKRDSTC